MPLRRSLSFRLGLLLQLGTIAVSLCVAVQLAQLLTGVGGAAATHDLVAWMDPVCLVLTGLLVLLRGIAVRAESFAWTVMGAGMVLFGLGFAYFSLFLTTVESAPYPSVSDALWLSVYPTAYVALVLLLKARVPRFHNSMWLDGLIGATAVGALGAALVIPRILAAASGSLAAVVTNLAYPSADLVLLALLVGVFALNGWHPGRAWTLILLGFATLAVSDVTYLSMIAAGTYREGTLNDVGYPAAMLLLLFAAWQRPLEAQRGQAVVRLEGWIMLLVPIGFTLTALGVLLFDHGHAVNLAAVALSAATIILSLARTAYTFREVRELAESRQQALTDDLTGLGNRRFLHQRLSSVIEQAATRNECVVVMILDLDGFKQLNDTLGHAIGDVLLRQVSSRLSEAFPAGTLLARMGGDEFAVIRNDPGNAAAASDSAREARAILFDRPYEVGGMNLRVDGSLGIARYPDHGADRDTLLRRAGMAMQTAKTARTGVASYTPQSDASGRDQLALLSDLRGAFANDELVLHYQPKADARTGEVSGVEALVRWQHPTRGLLGPNLFLDLVVQAGLMVTLTSRLLLLALEQSARWRDEGLMLGVAVNISTTNLLDEALPNQVAHALERTATPPHLLTLEITEGTLMGDPERARTVLQALRALGVRVAIDDYGTGYSSLAYLKNLAVDELKLDRSFVAGIAADHTDTHIVGSTIDLAHNLELEVVAEGVENELTWSHLRELGCDTIQGFYLARPAPAEQLTPWLHERRNPSRPVARHEPTCTESSRESVLTSPGPPIPASAAQMHSTPIAPAT